jgi:hypothetical protein
MTKADYQAFPGLEEDYIGEHKVGSSYHLGLTVREYFAVMALQGLLAAPDVDVRDGAGYVDPSKLTDWAVLYADALIHSLNADRGELDAKAATLTPSTGTKIQ